MVQTREQELVADMKDEHQAAMTQWREEAERADAKSAAQLAQVLSQPSGHVGFQGVLDACHAYTHSMAHSAATSNMHVPQHY